MATLPGLPVEIVDRIFHGFRRSRDTRSLKACALISRLFLPISRRHLFNKVTLRVTISSVDRNARVYHDCLKFLSDDDHVASFVRILRIVPHEPHANLLAIDEHHPRPLTLEEATKLLHTLRKKATSLKDLSIHSNMLSDWTAIDAPLRFAVFSLCNITTLQRLELRNIGISPDQLEQFVGPESPITALTLHGVYHVKPGTVVSNIQVPAPRNASTFHDHQGGDIQLELNVILESVGSSHLLIPIVHKAGKRLSSLKWKSNPSLADEDTFFHLLDLRRMPSLKEITISLPLRSNTGLADLITFLSFKPSHGTKPSRDLPSPFETSLESIVLEFKCQTLPVERVYGSWNWDTLDKALTESRHNVDDIVHMRKGAHTTIPESNALTSAHFVHPRLQHVMLSLQHTHSGRTHLAMLDSLFDIFHQNLPRAAALGLVKKQTNITTDSI